MSLYIMLVINGEIVQDEAHNVTGKWNSLEKPKRVEIGLPTLLPMYLDIARHYK